MKVGNSRGDFIADELSRKRDKRCGGREGIAQGVVARSQRATGDNIPPPPPPPPPAIHRRRRCRRCGR